MKNHLLIVVIVSLLFQNSLIIAQNLTVDGNAYLEFQEDHREIKVKFERIAPSFYVDSVFTDSLGHYQIDIESGVYNISFSKEGYVDVSIENSLYSNTTIEDQYMEEIGLSGELFGYIEQGIYKIGGDIFVPENESLQIEEGSVFLFKQDVKFEIFGELIAIGSVEDSIIFSHYNESESWKGIDFKEGSSSESILKYSIIEYSNDRGISVFKSHPQIEKCLVQFNSHEGSVAGSDEEDGGGAGICLKYSNTILKHMMIINNSGTTLGCGIYCNDGSPGIENSIIAYNKNYDLGDMRPGGGIYSSANLEIENCVIANNENSLGAGVYISSQGTFIPSVTIENCIISENYSNYGAGGVSFWNESTEVLNSLIWNNEGGNFYCDNDWLGVNVTININSDSCDAYGNINNDPMFIDQTEFDFQLMESSPCIDAGSNDLVNTIKDFNQNYRIWNANNYDTSYVDMGAYEYGSEINPTGLEKIIDDQKTITCLYPNPSSDHIKINAANYEYIEIWNLKGQMVLRSIDNDINISKLTKGMYFAKICTASSINFEVLKFVKE